MDMLEPSDTKAMQIFNFDDHAVRVVLVDGEPWWVAADVAKALGYRNAPDAVRMLRPDQTRTHSVRTSAGPRQATILSESGLYRLVMRSDRPDAERFQDWVTDEVLPSIRRTGSYSVADRATPTVVDLRKPGQMAEILIQAIEIAEEERARADREQARAEAAEAVVEAQRPDVEFVERFVGSDSTFGIREAAKTLGIYERDLIAWMLDKGYVTRLRGRIMPSHVGLERGYVVAKINEWRDGTGESHSAPRTWVTPKGMEYIGKAYDGPRKRQLTLVAVK